VDSGGVGAAGRMPVVATLGQWVQGARPRTLPAAVAPVLVGSAAAYYYLEPVLAAPGTPGVEEQIERAWQEATVAVALSTIGACRKIFEDTLQYAKDRVQYERPIGSFQAIKHKLADMLVDLEHARSTAYHAVWALSDASDDPALTASIAQATASAAFSRIAADTIQVHGGIGFTWEHQAHLYFKRAATDAALLGTAEEHRSRVADMVLETAVADADGARVATGFPA